MAATEVIDRQDAMSGLEQLLHGVGANVSGGAGNQYVHGGLPFSVFRLWEQRNEGK
jgi:hypothetical protein